MKSRSGLGATPFKSPDFNDPFFFSVSSVPSSASS